MAIYNLTIIFPIFLLAIIFPIFVLGLPASESGARGGQSGHDEEFLEIDGQRAASVMIEEELMGFDDSPVTENHVRF